MALCVIYARVSTKEQQAEGYSIPAQLKAIRAFCTQQGLEPVAEFIEAESAGKAGRTEFGRMVAFLTDRADVRVVVAHKLDRLYRNFRDQITLEDLGVKARYVQGDIPDTPQGELLRDVNLSVAKFYLGNLREEVKKGMDEKVAQGGFPHWAPVGYLNDKNTRSLVVDPAKAPLVRLAFERYATGSVSLSQLSRELFELGLTSRVGRRISPGALHVILRNPIYTGRIRYKERIVPGNHAPIVDQELFDRVQAAFEPNRNGVKETKHSFALRDYLVCAECGCKITAERQRGHIYYRCTHGKGKDACGQRKYTREEALFPQIDELLRSIALEPDIVAALVRDSRALDEEARGNTLSERKRLSARISELDVKAGKLLDGYLEGVVPVDAYRAKADELSAQRSAFERQLHELESGPSDKTAQVEALALTASRARVAFAQADLGGKRKLLSTLLLNASLDSGEIVSSQLKRPFEVLRRDSKGAFLQSWWAIVDGLGTEDVA